MRGKWLLLSSGIAAFGLFGPVTLAVGQDSGKTTGTSGQQQEQSEKQDQKAQQKQGEQGEGIQASSVSEMTVQEIRGSEVNDKGGKKVGSIGKVVRHKENNELGVVVESGGFLGMGGTEIFVPMEELEIQEDSVVWTEQVQEGELDKKNEYNAQKFAAIGEQNPNIKLSELKQQQGTQTFPTGGQMDKKKEKEQQKGQERRPQGQRQQ